ncbi:hypothetical protein COF46_25895 [Bacillus pseudomycoides]|uniref:Uncharacterized protein n=5 Tax=Bacillaceae TaxID=186817 RepID=A0AAJ1Z5K2_9BACI|nr:hypothetical protein [Bacillus pseudomycoides]EEM02523.1 hypothetical protein bmyco0002_50970 [Bacillus pseudomycoides]MDR4187783.1 hypothetical protein [Bacillus pseudomycoides]MDR4329164.1 hypothetical protein [Bacillus pseudomycoides]PEK59471.1 hypothetical protein CN593_29035 [Bacillus pseudomycoides]PEO38983.1 hypothetical protein CN559_29580 [Bacillus pseudomycoides]
MVPHIEQREIIERKYLKSEVMSDKAIKAQMMLANDWYYYQKKNAVMAIAIALRIIEKMYQSFQKQMMILRFVSKFYNENKNEIERSRESVLKFTKRNVD